MPVKSSELDRLREGVLAALRDRPYQTLELRTRLMAELKRELTMRQLNGVLSEFRYSGVLTSKPKGNGWLHALTTRRN